MPWREKIASATLSKVVRSSNTLTSWKLRAMPALTRSVTEAWRDVLALEDDLAGLGLQQRADDVDERGLAGAVGADQRDELALLDASG